MSPEKCSDKVNLLQKHIAFVTEMARKVKGTPHEMKFQRFLGSIANEHKLTTGQVKKIDKTIADLKLKLKNKRASLYRPIAFVKTENPDEDGNVAKKLKIEPRTQKDVDTDECDSEDGDERTSLKTSKAVWEQRSHSSESKDSGVENLLEKESPRSSVDEVNQFAEQAPAPSDDDRKVLELKALLKRIAEGSVNNDSTLLHSFEEIIGKEAFKSLKALFIETFEKSPQSDSRRSVPEAPQTSQGIIEAGRLKAGIMEMLENFPSQRLLNDSTTVVLSEEDIELEHSGNEIYNENDEQPQPNDQSEPPASIQEPVAQATIKSEPQDQRPAFTFSVDFNEDEIITILDSDDEDDDAHPTVEQPTSSSKTLMSDEAVAHNLWQQKFAESLPDFFETSGVNSDSSSTQTYSLESVMKQNEYPPVPAPDHDSFDEADSPAEGTEPTEPPANFSNFLERGSSIRNEQLKSCLRPWIAGFDNKDPIKVREMLQESCLKTMYKCMAFKCSFFTNGQQTYRTHLLEHKEKNCDARAYGRCSYCAFHTLNVFELVGHIAEAHKHDKFGCNLCFYRSVSKFCVENHQRMHHVAWCHKTVLLTQHISELRLPEAFQEATVLRAKFVPSITCFVCKSKFYNTDVFLKHLKCQHSPEELQRKCNKCGEDTRGDNLRNHLESCYQVMPLACIFCRYGARLVEEMKVHLVNTHANKNPFYCDRKSEPCCEPSHPDSMPILSLI